MRDVTAVDWSTTLLGHASSMPVYISATALGRLGHPDGEMTLTRAAARHGVVQMVPTLASCSMEEIFGAGAPGQTFFFQLYVNRDRAVTHKLVQEAERRGAKALFITVDAPQLGRREKDMRQKFEADGPAAQEDAGGAQDRSQGAARAISVCRASMLSYLRRLTGGLELHRPGPELEGHRLVQEHHTHADPAQGRADMGGRTARVRRGLCRRRPL
jgi:hypothetical protein